MSRAEVPVGAADEHEDGSRARTGGRLLPSLIVVGLALAIFMVWSSRAEIAQRGMDGDGAPVYGELAPSFTPRGLFSIGVLLAASAIAWWTLRREPRPWKHVIALTLVAFSFAASLALVRYDTGGLAGTTFRNEAPSYQADLPLLRELGVRRMIREYPQVVPRFVSHMKTHPPGPLIGLDLLERASPGSPTPRGVVVGLLGASGVAPVWFIARRVADERAARIATVFAAVAPGPAIFAFTSLDAVLATILIAVAALLVAAVVGQGSVLRRVLAGLCLSLSLFFTYAGAFIGIFAALLAFAVHAPSDAVRRLATIGAGFAGGVALIVFVVEFDLVRSYQAFQEWLGPTAFQLRRSHAYWIGGNWGVWFLYAGVPITALMFRELIAKRPRYLVAFFAPLVAFYALPFSVTSLLPGENQRTLLFAYALAAVAAGANLARWENRAGAISTLAVPGLVVLSGANAILLRVLYVNFY